MAFTVGIEQRNIFSKLKTMQPARRLDLLSRTTQSNGESSPFSLLNPTQFAELFPKYYMKTKPDVRGFYDALSSKKRQGGEAGASTDSSTASVATGEKVTNTVKAKEIYDYIRSKGVDHTHAVGIVNNMKYESGFDSGALGDKQNGIPTSGGLFQHHASRFSAMKNYVGEGWQTNWKKQIDFAMTEGVMKKYLSVNYANPRDASSAFTEVFEVPANTKQTAAYRAGTADGYASAMEGRGGEPAGGQTPGGHYEVTSSGHVVPRNKGMYDPGNEEQCATLSKAFNPDIGRSSTWSVVPGQIKPGVVVATMRYNLPGGDRMGSGYHTGIALSAPDQDGNFLILDQSKGRSSAVRTVNANAYSGGSMGGTTQFGIISSNGRLHDEQSLEALKYAADRAPDEETKKKILSNYEAVTKGDTAGGATGGSYSVNTNPNAEGTPGPQTNLQQQEAVKSVQTATIGDMMRFMGDMSGFFSRGEGLGGNGGKKHKAPAHKASGSVDVYNPEVTASGLSKGSKLVDYQSSYAAKAIGLTQEQFNAVREAKASIESSGGNYNLRGGSSNRFSGAYQMGGDQIKEAAQFLGETAPVTKIKRKTVGNEQFLNDPFMQERYHDAYMTLQHNHLMKNKVYAAMKPVERAGVIGMAHNAGAGAASRFLRTGHISVDAFKTHPEKYASRIAQQIRSLENIPKQTQLAKAAAPTATVKPVDQPTPRGWYDKFIDMFSPAASTTSVAKERPKAEPVSRPSMLDKTPAKDMAPGVYEAPTNLDKSMMNPEPMLKDKQTFNMQQIPPDRPQGQLAIDKFIDRKNAEFPSPSLERHAFTIRQQQPTVGANYMHMGTNPG